MVDGSVLWRLYMAINQVLAKFDEAIQIGRKSDPSTMVPVDELKLRICEVIASSVKSPTPTANLEEFVLSKLDSDKLLNKKIIATCLARLLGEESFHWLSDPPWRPKVISLIDEQLSEELYSEWKINSQMMSHEKTGILAEKIKNIEKTLEGAVASLTSLDQLNSHRQRLFGAINSKSGKVLIKPFLPYEIEALLSELFMRANNYIVQRTSLNVIEARIRLIEESQHFDAALNKHKTTFSILLIEKISKKLIEMVEADFSNTSVAKPAELAVSQFEKKYPLHLRENTISLSIKLENKGPGYAYEAIVEIEYGDMDKLRISLSRDDINIGRVRPASRQIIQIPAKVFEAIAQLEVLVTVKWKNYDGTQKQVLELISFESQRDDIAWESLRNKDVYSLEPIINEQELIGREDLLRRLLATSESPTVGSSIIQGQKRVGKTSIARAIQSRLAHEGGIIVYLEGGSYVQPSAKATISNLGNRICNEIIKNDIRFTNMTRPAFDDALSPLDEFLQNVRAIAPERKVMIILDEFDELPLDLYVRNSLGNAFFLTLRSISSQTGAGIILVGGEKMSHIMESQADKLNKWNVTRVDYFSRDADWLDYKELVQKPTRNVLEFTEDAVIALHDVTAGNPYFTKLICRYILDESLRRHDCHITRAEIEQAVNNALREIERNTFQHFWEDGIFEAEEKAAERSVLRRRILIAISDILNKSESAPFKDISKHPLMSESNNLKNDLQEFVTRRVLDCKSKEDLYTFKVPLFHFWLKERGIQDVIATFASLNAALQERARLEKNKVQSNEIVQLTDRWGAYKGQKLTEDRIRAWLDQFDHPDEQRLMFQILGGLKFYTNSFVREKLREIHALITKGMGRTIGLGQLKRDDILVSYLDGPSKSGSFFAKLYADEGSIYVDNIVEKGKIREKIEENKDIQAIVFIDDFVGTGEQSTGNLLSIIEEIETIAIKRNLRIVFVAIVGFTYGWRNLESRLDNLNITLITRCCELLDETAQCFSEKSSLFTDPDSREKAKEVATRYGRKLEKDCPLGYGDLGLAVIFEHGCPNNTLPILWSESTNPVWNPLFRRH